jgi:general secretion pathway protein F
MENKKKLHTYIVKFQDRRGRIVTTEIDSDSQYNAEIAIRKRGKIINIKKRGLSLWNYVAMTPGERQTFLRNLSTLLVSGKGSSDSLRAIEYSFSGTIKMVSSKMLAQMENGVSLIDAMSNTCEPKHIAETTMALIRAGERSGKSWKALSDAAEFEQEMEDMRKGSNKDLIVAIMGFTFAMVLVIVSEFWVKDYFEELLAGMSLGDGKGNPIVDFVSKLTLWAMGFTGFIFIFLLLLGTVGKKIMPLFSDKIILKIPFFNTLVLSRNNYITLYGLSLMVTSGVSMERALLLSETSARKGALKQDLGNAVKAVKKGSPWALCMSTFHDVDKAALDGAVDKAQIANILHHLAKNNRDTYKQVAGMVGPMLQMLAATFVIISGAVLFGHTMLPMLQASAQAFQ